MMKVKIDYPSRDEEKEILARMGTLGPRPEAKPVLTGEAVLEARKVVNDIYVDEKIISYILDIVFATRNPQNYGVKTEGLLLFGASPRASLNLKMGVKARAFLSGRAYATPNDVKQIAHDVLRHRLRRTYEAEAENISSDEIIDRILDTIPVP
jgi:MoxR-like ATPase